MSTNYFNHLQIWYLNKNKKIVDEITKWLSTYYSVYFRLLLLISNISTKLRYNYLQIDIFIYIIHITEYYKKFRV